MGVLRLRGTRGWMPWRRLGGYTGLCAMAAASPLCEPCLVVCFYQQRRPARGLGTEPAVPGHKNRTHDALGT